MRIQRKRKLQAKQGLGVPPPRPDRRRPISPIDHDNTCDICGSTAESRMRIVGGGFPEEGHTKWMKRTVSPKFDPDQADNQICLCWRHLSGAGQYAWALIPSEEDLNALILLQSNATQSQLGPSEDYASSAQLSGWFEYLPVYISNAIILREYVLACKPRSFPARLPVRIQSRYRPEFAKILGKARTRRDGRIEVYIGNGRLNVWALVLHGLTALGGVTLHETPRFTAVHQKLLQLRTLCSREIAKHRAA